VSAQIASTRSGMAAREVLNQFSSQPDGSDWHPHCNKQITTADMRNRLEITLHISGNSKSKN
jgi:hypothetical protein